MRIRNKILIIVFCAVLVGPFALWIAQAKMKLPLPDFVTAEGAAYLAGGKSDTSIKDKFSLTGFADKSLQEALENKIGNYIPAKGSALLTNAYLQRTAIATSNNLFDWECYPTYFGSSHLYIPSKNSICTFPAIYKESIPELSSFCKELKKFSHRNPEINIKLYIVDYSTTSSINPSQKYLKKRATTSDFFKYLDKRLKKCQNIEVFADCHNDIEAYYDFYFRSDHHWNARGALQAYTTLYKNDKNAATITEAGYKNIDGPLYSGSYSRNGLCIVEDKPFDFEYGFDEIDLENDGNLTNGSSHILYENASEQKKHWDFYDLYYRDAQKATNNKAKRNAVMVSDSFGGALLRPVATNYEDVKLYSYFHFCATSDVKLQDLIDGQNISDIILVAHPDNYLSFLGRNPQFFKE